jgi:protein ImuA
MQGLSHVGIPVDRVLCLNPSRPADALWSAEQILRAGTCGALLFWQRHIRTESLRRLLLAARAGETLFFLLRSLDCARDASPAEVRLALRPAADGLTIEVIKRRGPDAGEPVVLELQTAA